MTRAEQLIDTLRRLGYPSGAWVVDQTDGNLTLIWRSGTGRTIEDLLSDATQAALPPRVATWSCREFLLRFTPEERCDIIRAGKASEEIEDLYRLLLAAPEVRSDSAELQGGLAMLVDASLLTAERRDQILGVA